MSSPDLYAQLAECRERINQLAAERNRLQAQVDQHAGEVNAAFRTALLVGSRRLCEFCRHSFDQTIPATMPAGTLVSSVRVVAGQWKHSVVQNGVEYFYRCGAWALQDLLYGPVSAQIQVEDV